MRVAIVHYWFLVYGGGERVVEALAGIYPQADLFALFAEQKSVPQSLQSRRLQTSFLDRSSLLRGLNRAMFPLYPMAVESLDVRNYDLVITSDSPPMKGVITTKDQVHLCYVIRPGGISGTTTSHSKVHCPGLPNLDLVLRPSTYVDGITLLLNRWTPLSPTQVMYRKGLRDSITATVQWSTLRLTLREAFWLTSLATPIYMWAGWYRESGLTY